MFARGYLWALVVAVALVALALSTARPSRGASIEERHVVRPGETLWEIAAERYGGDPRRGVWRIQQRNQVEGGFLEPGTVLYLPP
jgi:LysM repeat protein